jgi:hypothetical protein
VTLAAALNGAAWRVVLAAPPTPGGPGNPPGSERGEEFGKTSPIALVVILLLGLATVLLIRSMNKRLRNVPASFGDDVPTATSSTVGRSEQFDGGPAEERIDPSDQGRRGGPTEST